MKNSVFRGFDLDHHRTRRGEFKVNRQRVCIQMVFDPLTDRNHRFLAVEIYAKPSSASNATMAWQGRHKWRESIDNGEGSKIQL